ncbi:MAG TPA: low temperature requirement protein A [Thermomicrobiales bacterium]|nr:low temperature requirement protein A [Thermomicrobiales bacterium]
MAERAANAPLLRPQGEREHPVTNLELFFDLVYVFAVTQLSHVLLTHLTVRGALHTLLLLLAVWWAWIYTAWITNWFDPNQRVVRAILLLVMLASLIMSAALPEAFGERGLIVAAAYAAMQVGRSLFAVAALRGEPILRRNFERITIWATASGLLWLAGGFAHGAGREGFWVAAVIIDYLSPAAGYYSPGLGRSTTADWHTISGAHLAERCQLFLIVALGESIVVIGATLSERHFTAGVVAAVVVAFIGSVAFWWIYFDRSAELGSQVIGSTTDPGRLGRSAYTYFHLPMVAGIIVAAVGDELSIAHPSAHPSNAGIAVVLGGPALFLAGHALYKWSVFNRLSVARLVAIALLALLVPFGLIAPMLLLAAAAAMVVIAVGGWDAITIRAALQSSSRQIGSSPSR